MSPELKQQKDGNGQAVERHEGNHCFNVQEDSKKWKRQEDRAKSRETVYETCKEHNEAEE